VDSISFSIPLAAPSEKVILLNKQETEESTTTPVEGCKYDPTDPAGIPVAPAGTLCVFTTVAGGESGHPSSVNKANFNGTQYSDSRTGAYIYGETSVVLEELGIGKFDLAGAWAVTAK
jgi:hypothetical protein